MRALQCTPRPSHRGARQLHEPATSPKSTAFGRSKREKQELAGTAMIVGLKPWDKVTRFWISIEPDLFRSVMAGWG